MKKPISTRLHGVLDYVAGTTLIIPWVVNFFEDNSDTWILAMAGLFTVIMSLLTNYEMGLVKVIPMKLHLFLDVMLALLLIGLPFLYPMYHYYLYWPVAIGVCELIIVVLSSSKAFQVTKRDLNITQPSS